MQSSSDSSSDNATLFLIPSEVFIGFMKRRDWFLLVGSGGGGGRIFQVQHEI